MTDNSESMDPLAVLSSTQMGQFNIFKWPDNWDNWIDNLTDVWASTSLESKSMTSLLTSVSATPFARWKRWKEDRLLKKKMNRRQKVVDSERSHRDRD